MKALAVDFRPVPSPGRRHWSAALFLTALAVGTAAVWAVKAHQAAATAPALSALHSAAQEAQLVPGAPAVSGLYDASARLMLRERGHFWPAALRALENTRLKGVRLEAITIGIDSGDVRVDVTVADHRTLADYLSALNAGHHLGSGVLRWALEYARAEPSSTDIRASLVAKLS